MRLKDIMTGIRIAKYVPLIIALMTKFKMLVDTTDDLLDQIEDAATGKKDLIIPAGSAEAVHLNHTFRRLHNLTNTLDNEL